MKKKGMSRKTACFLHIVQHVCLVAAVVSLLIVAVGSNVLLEGNNTAYAYTISQNDRESAYEESDLFNYILGRNVADVIQFCAIRSQMETDGEFDPQKEVDVTAYANRGGSLPAEYVTVKYPLEDLIKWGQNGLEYEEIWYSGEEAAEFLSQTTTVTRLEENASSGGSLWNSYLNPEIEKSSSSVPVTANSLEDGRIERDSAEGVILTNRYKTVDGKNIEDYVSTWQEYYDLCSHVDAAATDLAHNYGLYLTDGDYYDPGNSNIRYYISRTVGERTEVFTNIADAPLHVPPEEITELFGRYGSHLFYDPVNMNYEGNTRITEDTLRNLVSRYEYAYPEDTKIWVGVDTAFPVRDEFVQGAEGLKNYAPYYWQLVGFSLAAFVLYLVLLLALTVNAGRAVDEEGKPSISLNRFDRLPTEFMLFLGCLAGAGLVAIILQAGDVMTVTMYYSPLFIVGAGAYVLLVELLFTLFYYSIVRRLKANSLWRDSLIRMGFSRLKSVAVDAYDNGGVTVRTWGPYLLFLLVNLLLVLAFDRIWMGILTAAVLDLAVGALIYRNNRNRQKIVEGIERIKAGEFDYKIDKEKFHGDNLVLADAVNTIGESIRDAVETSMKDERLKADLITNVSHDIKTPLTSIINYVDLIKRENIQDEKIKGYIEVLDAKSQRLKQLTDDLVEASKISSGNLPLHMERINLVELVNQTLGEFSEKFEQKKLAPYFHTEAGSLFIEADSRRIWRVIENLFGNIFKYALEGTRVYIDMDSLEGEDGRKHVELSIKNISAQPLNINAEELTERFIRGDVARSSEGSGLGLSIAKSLTEAQKGSFRIHLDGDLFKVVLTFPLLEDE